MYAVLFGPILLSGIRRGRRVVFVPQFGLVEGLMVENACGCRSFEVKDRVPHYAIPLCLPAASPRNFWTVISGRLSRLDPLENFDSQFVRLRVLRRCDIRHDGWVKTGAIFRALAAGIFRL